jgi:hypothetical protein
MPAACRRDEEWDMVGRLRAAGNNRVCLAIVLAVLGLLVAMEPPQVTRTSSFANGTAVSKWMLGYYRRPEPHRAADAIAVLSAEGGLGSEHRLMTVAAFLAGVIDLDVGAVAPLVAHAAKAGAEQQRLVVQAAVLSRRREEALPGAVARMAGAQATAARLLADRGPADTLRQPIGDAAALDLYWAYFMATGSGEALAAIVASVAGTLQDSDRQGLMLGYAAKWSLTFNAIQHARVMEACRRAAGESGPLAGALRDVVAAAEAGDARPIRRAWQAAVRAWSARQEPARELSARGAKGGA